MLAREDALEAVTGERFDVVVIGGGITGAGTALDAASRGYTVALVERDDYAVGTSSRSSKMVHGGLRYLQNFDLGLVREALLERQLMVQLAPHLVYPTPFLVPTLGEDRRSRMIGIGLNMYDVMATTRVGMSRRERTEREQGEDYWAPDRHRTIPAEEVVELIPALASRDPKSAYLFYDCQTDDVRLVLTILGEAERYGAVSVNRSEVTGLIDRSGGADGVLCRDLETGDEFEIEADNVINATGVWADRIRPEEILEEEEVPRIAPSRGTHVTVSASRLPLHHAACVVPAGEERTIFALPWYGRTLIGTTDNDYDGEIAHVQPAAEDVDYLLGAANTFFRMELGPADVTGAYAGVRPLISTGDPRKSVDISRKAELYETSSGLLTITGGKLTTWRRMAKLVVDRMVEREGREALCRTDDIPLGLAVADGDLDPPEGLSEDDLPEGYRDLLAFRYGHAGRDVLRLAGERPELAGPIVEDQPDLLAEAAIAARLEQARSLADVLLRRTRLGILAAPQLRTAESVRPVAEAMGAELGWDAERVRREAEGWVAEAEAEGIDPAKALGS
ncbi:MAG TPA: glycerol-3-phosphate dehydrogenase/oxidase [Solirubrobacterales bacterium]|jgi:glycerol-3-phosphate dehydrogenase|nr:glycerol-3-phosphate dehydrogenase/oxidase [Solirubrobacterales bacterium]